MSETNFIRVKQAAAKLGVSENWLYRRASNNRIAHYRRGRIILFRLDEIEQIMFERVVE